MIYKDSRAQGRLQEVSAAKAGISIRSGRRLEKGELQPQQGQPRHWRTREDPLEAVWPELEQLLQQQSGLKAITLLGYLEQQYPDQNWQPQQRTLQRRVRQWRQQQGQKQRPPEVMFPQVYEPGGWGFSDFTELKGEGITIGGELYPHRFYHYRLAYSGWEHVEVIRGGESFVALSWGLQNALEQCGGVPRIHRTDSLSAAFRNQVGVVQADQTCRYEQLCVHYGMQPSRNNRGKGHENGRIEVAHGHFKRQLEQALLLRGSRDFESDEEYRSLVAAVVGRANRGRAERFARELNHLQALPQQRFADYEVESRVVSKASTIDLRCVLYSVPAALIGQRVTLQLRHDSIDIYQGHQLVTRLQRHYAPTRGSRRIRVIDFRHVIGALRRKPRALLQCQWREELLPNPSFRRFWRQFLEQYGPDLAARLMVEALHIAAEQDNLSQVEGYLAAELEHRRLDLVSLQRHFRIPPLRELPVQQVVQHPLESYDHFLATGESLRTRAAAPIPVDPAQPRRDAQPLAST